VYACLGSVSLVSGKPSPSAVAQGLAASGSVRERLKAALLFEMDNRYEEAAILLRELPAEGPMGSLVLMALGDALYEVGDGAEADTAWARAALDPRWRALADLRRRMGRMAAGGPRTWGRELPTLVALSRRSDRIGAESVWLLQQVAEVQGDWETAAERAAELWRFHPQLARAVDAPERLLTASLRRVDLLLGEQRPVESLAFFDNTWRAELDRAIVDPTLLYSLAQAAESLGLYDRALSLHLRGMGVDVAVGRETLGPVLELARLYARVGRGLEAKDALEYARKLPEGRARRRDVDLALAALLQSEGDLERARPLWRRAGGPVAEAWLTLVEEDCDALVQRAAPPEAPDGPEQVRWSLERLECLVSRGEPAEAEALAEALQGRAQPEEIAAARGRHPEGSILARLAQEEAQQAAWTDPERRPAATP
jgi:tetratricopeptide (TPR) repeat protein